MVLAFSTLNAGCSELSSDCLSICSAERDGAKHAVESTNATQQFLALAATGHVASDERHEIEHMFWMC